MKRFLLIPVFALLCTLGVSSADAQLQGGHPNDCTYNDALIGHCVQVVLVDSLSSTQKAAAYDAIYRGLLQARCSGTGPVVYCVLGGPVGDVVAVGVDGATCRAVRDLAGVVVRFDCVASALTVATPVPSPSTSSVPTAPVLVAPIPSFTG